MYNAILCMYVVVLRSCESPGAAPHCLPFPTYGMEGTDPKECSPYSIAEVYVVKYSYRGNCGNLKPRDPVTANRGSWLSVLCRHVYVRG